MPEGWKTEIFTVGEGLTRTNQGQYDSLIESNARQAPGLAIFP
jgi:hypothetical protein